MVIAHLLSLVVAAAPLHGFILAAETVGRSLFPSRLPLVIHLLVDRRRIGSAHTCDNQPQVATIARQIFVSVVMIASSFPRVPERDNTSSISFQ